MPTITRNSAIPASYQNNSSQNCSTSSVDRPDTSNTIPTIHTIPITRTTAEMLVATEEDGRRMTSSSSMEYDDNGDRDIRTTVHNCPPVITTSSTTTRRSRVVVDALRRVFQLDNRSSATADPIPTFSPVRDDDHSHSTTEGSSSDLRPSPIRQAAELQQYRRPSYRGWTIGLIAALAGVLLVTSQRRRHGSSHSVCADIPPSVTPTTTSSSSSSSATLSALVDHTAATSLLRVPSAAVASDQGVCSRLAATIVLEEHQGNAVDAAVTTALCLGVVNPASSGLGGGGFLLIRAPVLDQFDVPDFVDARQSSSSNDITNNETTNTEGGLNRTNPVTDTYVIDCREMAPSEASTHMYDSSSSTNNASVWGGLAVAIPGELACLALAHAKFGSVPWNHLVSPVVQLATEGVPVTRLLATEIASTARRFQKDDATDSEVDDDDTNDHFAYSHALRKVLTQDDNWDHPLEEGATLRNPMLVTTLELIAREGMRALYAGSRATAMVEELTDQGGIVTTEDLASYRAVLRDPVLVEVQGLRVVGVPPPSSGGAVILGALLFLAGFAEPLATFGDTLTAHRLVEACKHAFAIRMSLSDPLYNTETVHDAVADLLLDEYMSHLRNEFYSDSTIQPLSSYGGPKWAQLNDTEGEGSSTAQDAQEGDRRRNRRRRRKLLRPFGYLEDHGTSHFSVVDELGNAVGMTTSVNTIFGSCVMSPSTGILFGNTMDDFAKPGQANYFGLQPAESNYIKPGKRPLSSMSPTMIFRGDKLMLVVGASGGPKIITAVLQVILRHVMMGQSLLEAMLYPRLHDQLIYHGSGVTTTEHSELHGPNGGEINVFNSTRKALVARKHELLDVDYMGTVQAISVDLEANELSAACDPRKGGSPSGY